VHAADAEMALQNGRDVFVRRPDCISLWVVRASEVTTFTSEELESLPTRPEVSDDSKPQEYLVFRKTDYKGSHEHVGTVKAMNSETAVWQGMKTFGIEDVLVWMVCPLDKVHRSEREDIPSHFEPALDKKYRDQAFYRTVTLMRRLRTKGSIDES
jgi:1,2-phenylacetyl-CoA epoxidase PaaB subunit